MTTPVSGARELVRAEVARLPLLSPDSGSTTVDLSDNTNLWGAPPAAIEALVCAEPLHLSRYPSLYSEPLRAGLLAYVGLGGAADVGVVTGCGSDDVLDSTMRAFGARGARIAFSTPTFSMIPLLARLNGLECVGIPLSATYDVDAERLVNAGAAITYVCAPNNPTGTAASRAAVEYVVSNARGMVIIDEAYAEFAPEVFTDLVTRNDRVIAARTFSKAFGLAGMRVGYGVCSATTARLVERARGPYKVGSLAERTVLSALGDEEGALAWVRAKARAAIENRGRLVDELTSRGMMPLPSAANFVLVPRKDSREFARALAARGVLVRAFSGLPVEIPAFAESGGSALRFGVGPWPMMQALLAAIDEVAR